MSPSEGNVTSKCHPFFETVILSEAKDLLSFRSPGKQILRLAQDDSL
jgi:hypothetical protein